LHLGRETGKIRRTKTSFLGGSVGYVIPQNGQSREEKKGGKKRGGGSGHRNVRVKESFVPMKGYHMEMGHKSQGKKEKSCLVEKKEKPFEAVD